MLPLRLRSWAHERFAAYRLEWWDLPPRGKLFCHWACCLMMLMLQSLEVEVHVFFPGLQFCEYTFLVRILVSQCLASLHELFHWNEVLLVFLDVFEGSWKALWLTCRGVGLQGLEDEVVWDVNALELKTEYLLAWYLYLVLLYEIRLDDFRPD